MGILAIFAIVAVLIVYIKTTNTQPKSPSATKANTSTSYTATIPPNELLAYRQGGPLWVHYYAKQSTIHNESRVQVCLQVAELIKKCFDGNCTEVQLNRPGASLQYITLAYMHDKVQLICYFNEPNSEYSFFKAYSEINQTYSYSSDTYSTVFNEEDRRWMYKATLSNLIDIPEDCLHMAMYMHNGQIYKDANHYRLYHT